MASRQFRNGVYRLLFKYHGWQATHTIGSVSLAEARQWKFRTENLLMRVRQGMKEGPAASLLPSSFGMMAGPRLIRQSSIVKKGSFHFLGGSFDLRSGCFCARDNSLATSAAISRGRQSKDALVLSDANPFWLFNERFLRS